jgi:hypothetical protein
MIENTKCKNKKKQKVIQKKCKYPGCNVEFTGIYVTKYCKEHRKSHYRIRKPTEYENITVKNQIYKHDQKTDITVIESKCSLEGCNNKFNINLFPNQFVYPKFCQEHRSEHKRNMFLKKG